MANGSAEAAAQTIFLLSPADCRGKRAAMLANGAAEFPLARALRSEGAALGEVFAFLSALYFRGKVTYARRFARAPEGFPGVVVIAPGREAREEAGVEVVVERVSGVYASPLIEYPNGDVARYTTTAFRCRYVSGEPRVTDDESLDVRFFSMDALPADLRPDHIRMLNDAAEPGADVPARFDL